MAIARLRIDPIQQDQRQVTKEVFAWFYDVPESPLASWPVRIP
jgi:hypothetical protein